MTNKTIGFIGTGTIGAPMAERLIDADHSLMVYDLSREATVPHERKGALRAEGVSEVARSCDVVFLSLPGPKQIQEVMLGEDGVLSHTGKGSIVVDLSTNSLSLNRKIAGAAVAQGADYLDAPVSGGRIGAQQGKLAVMVGGDEAAFTTVKPAISTFGENIFYMGASGNGTLTKLVNNQIFLSASVLIQEGFLLGAKSGMDPRALLDVLKVSSAGSVVGAAPLMLSRDFHKDIFALAIAAKDVGLAVESADEIGVDMPMTKAASDIYGRALAAGFGDDDFYATVKALEASAGMEIPPLRKSSKKEDRRS